MVLHHLDRPHILVAYAVGGDAVFTAEQVGAFDIELVYVLALILYLAGLLHIDTRHTFEHITDRAVLSLGKGTDSIGDRISLFPYAVSLNCYLFQQCRTRFHIDSQRKFHAIKRNRLLGEAHHRHLKTATGNRRQRHSKAAVAL